MDIKQIRIDAKLLVGRMPNDTISWRVANEMLRILDAFDAMAEARFGIVVDSEGFYVVDEDGEFVTDAFPHPLAALLAATETPDGH